MPLYSHFYFTHRPSIYWNWVESTYVSNVSKILRFQNRFRFLPFPPL